MKRWIRFFVLIFLVSVNLNIDGGELCGGLLQPVF